MGIPKTTELSSRLIHELGTNRFVLRLIKVGESDPPHRKFGISRLWYNNEINCWLPSKNNHVYLPVSAVQAFKRTFDQFAAELGDDNHNEGPSCGNAGTDGPHSTESEAIEQPVDATDATTTASAPKSDVAAKRKRGRPCSRNRVEAENAPRYNVHINAESGSDTSECEKKMGTETVIV
jgi:hypothetical protein